MTAVAGALRQSRPGLAPRARGDRGSIQSVDRALNLLEAIAEAGGETSLTDLSLRTGLNISTCHHLLATLFKRGYVAKLPNRRTYALGSRILHLGNACLRQVDLPRRAAPYITRVNEATGETVHLAVLENDNVVTLVTRDARHAVRVEAVGVGIADAPHASANGKAMLAWLPDAEMRRILEANGGTPRFTPNTITNVEALVEELRLVRRNGFAQDREEFRPGVVGVACAIRDHTGAVVGAISASAPTMRASKEHLLSMREEVTGAARALSTELGAPAAIARKPARTQTRSAALS